VRSCCGWVVELRGGGGDGEEHTGCGVGANFYVVVGVGIGIGIGVAFFIVLFFLAIVKANEQVPKHVVVQLYVANLNQKDHLPRWRSARGGASLRIRARREARNAPEDLLHGLRDYSLVGWLP